MSAILFSVRLVNGFPPSNITGIQPSSSSCYPTSSLYFLLLCLSSASTQKEIWKYLFYCKPWLWSSKYHFHSHFLVLYIVAWQEASGCGFAMHSSSVLVLWEKEGGDPRGQLLVSAIGGWLYCSPDFLEDVSYWGPWYTGYQAFPPENPDPICLDWF